MLHGKLFILGAVCILVYDLVCDHFLKLRCDLFVFGILQDSVYQQCIVKVVGVRLAEQCSVKIEDSNTVLYRNKIRTCLVCDRLHIGDQLLSCLRVLIPERQHFIGVNRRCRFCDGFCLHCFGLCHFRACFSLRCAGLCLRNRCRILLTACSCGLTASACHDSNRRNADHCDQDRRDRYGFPFFDFVCFHFLALILSLIDLSIFTFFPVYIHAGKRKTQHSLAFLSKKCHEKYIISAPEEKCGTLVSKDRVSLSFPKICYNTYHIVSGKHT